MVANNYVKLIKNIKRKNKNAKILLYNSFIDNNYDIYDNYDENVNPEYISDKSYIKNFFLYNNLPSARDITDTSSILSKNIQFDDDILLDVITCNTIVDNNNKIENTDIFNNINVNDEKTIYIKVHLLLKEAEKYDYFIVGDWSFEKFYSLDYETIKIWNNMIPLYNVIILFVLRKDRKKRFSEYLTIM